MTSAPQPQRGGSSSMPRAHVTKQRGVAWRWIIPAAALIFSIWLGVRAWSLRGTAITIQFTDGHGLKPGDEVRYRGITVGTVSTVDLSPSLSEVNVSLRLTSSADQLARTGTRFWIVRPQLTLTRVEGLETLIGPRHVAALPHRDGPERQQYHFIGLDQPPVVERIEPGDLEIVLQSSQRGSLHSGAPVTYRQTHIGTILSVGLAGDGSSVESRVHIRRPFVQLIRRNSQFWDVGGLKAQVGITGVTIDIESAEALLAGGVALATPPPQDAGDMVHTGHRFQLAESVDKDWLAWEPRVPIGSSLLPQGVAPPSPLRATLIWRQGRWINRQRSQQGWLLQTNRGLLGPVDLLIPVTEAQPESVTLEVAGSVLQLDTAATWTANGLALRPADVSRVRWPSAQLRRADEPEECLAIADPGGDPIPLTVSRLSQIDDQPGRWRIDPALAVDQSWHGACVVSRADGAVIGMILIEEDAASVALLPDQP